MHKSLGMRLVQRMCTDYRVYLRRVLNVHVDIHSGLHTSIHILPSTVVSRKGAHGQSILQVCQRGGWVFLRVFPHLTTKEHPCHVYSDWMPLKWIIGQTITDNGTTSGFEVKSWRHTTRWVAPCHCEHSVSCAFQTPCEACSRVGTHSGKLGR